MMRPISATNGKLTIGLPILNFTEGKKLTVFFNFDAQLILQDLIGANVVGTYLPVQQQVQCLVLGTTTLRVRLPVHLVLDKKGYDFFLF